MNKLVRGNTFGYRYQILNQDGKRVCIKRSKEGGTAHLKYVTLKRWRDFSESPLRCTPVGNISQELLKRV